MDAHWPVPFPSVFPVARAPPPHCSPPTLRRRAPVPARETGASSARGAARRRSLTRRAGCPPTWTSVSSTPCGGATTVTGRAPRQVWGPSEEAEPGGGGQVRDGDAWTGGAESRGRPRVKQRHSWGAGAEAGRLGGQQVDPGGFTPRRSHWTASERLSWTKAKRE